MVDYLIDTKFWLQWIIKKFCLSLHVKNILLTPVHDWIHECIWDWTRMWDPALNMSTVWPNWHQGIIYMLSDGMARHFASLAE